MDHAVDFLRKFSSFLKEFNISYSDLSKGSIKIGEVEIDLNKMFIEGDQCYAPIHTILKVDIPYNIASDPNFTKAVSPSVYPSWICAYCGSALKTKWFGLKKTDKCLNPNCGNYFKHGFDVIQLGFNVIHDQTSEDNQTNS